MKTLLLSALALALPVLPEARAERFDFSRDTFAFPNETYWRYLVAGPGGAEVRGTVEGAEYTRHCLVLCRATLQFRKFARFAPGEPRLGEAELADRIRQLARTPAWLPAKTDADRLVLPGFRSLRELSAAHPGVLKSALGAWWPTYWRYGNWRMAMPFPRAGQAATAELIAREIDRGETPVTFLTRFRPMNHAVIAFRYRRVAGGLLFDCYDPNTPDRPLRLRFDAAGSSFTFEKTPYWGGGRVNVFLTYRWPLS